MSGEFEINIGLRQRSTLNPLLFIPGVTDKQKDWYERRTPETIVCRRPGSGSSGGANHQEHLIEWKDTFRRLGLIVSLEKTEVMFVGHKRKALEIHLDGKKRKQRDSFVYMDGAICGDGQSDTEIHQRITAWENGWRNVKRSDGR